MPMRRGLKVVGSSGINFVEYARIANYYINEITIEC